LADVRPWESVRPAARSRRRALGRLCLTIRRDRRHVAALMRWAGRYGAILQGLGHAGERARVVATMQVPACTYSLGSASSNHFSASALFL
jgi:hypothetical protein